MGLPRWLSGKESACQYRWCRRGDAGDAVLIPGLGRSPGGGNGNPLQYSCLGNPMDSEVWWATVHSHRVGHNWVTEHTYMRYCDTLLASRTWEFYNKWKLNYDKTGFPWWFSDRESACQCRGQGFDPWSGEISHTMEQLTPWGAATEPVRLESAPQQKKPPQWEVCAPQLEKAMQQWSPSAAKKHNFF